MSELPEYDYSITTNDLDLSFFNPIVKIASTVPVLKKERAERATTINRTTNDDISQSVTPVITEVNTSLLSKAEQSPLAEESVVDDFYGDGNEQMVKENARDILDAAIINDNDQEKTAEVLKAEKDVKDMTKLDALNITAEKTETLDIFFKNIRTTMPFMSHLERAKILFQIVYCKLFTYLKFKDSAKAPTEITKLSTLDTIVKRQSDDEPARFSNAYQVVSNYVRLCKISGPGDTPLNKFITFVGSLNKDKITATSNNLKQSLTDLSLKPEVTKFLNENADKNYIKALTLDVITKFLIGNKTLKAPQIAKANIAAKPKKEKKRDDDEDDDDAEKFFEDDGFDRLYDDV